VIRFETLHCALYAGDIHQSCGALMPAAAAPLQAPQRALHRRNRLKGLVASGLDWTHNLPITSSIQVQPAAWLPV